MTLASIRWNSTILSSPIICRDAICEHPHSCGDFVKGVEPHGIGNVSTLSKIARITLASFENVDEQATMHPVPSTKKMRRICRYLGELVLHECGAPKHTILRDANSAYHRSAIPLEVDSILDILRSKDEDHMLSVIFVQQFVDTRIVR
jgi:hypothetical protein